PLTGSAVFGYTDHLRCTLTSTVSSSAAFVASDTGFSCRRAMACVRGSQPRQSSEGPLLAASRSASATNLGPRRVSFARINEPLKVPDLLALQTESFDWLLGNEKWK